MKPRDSINDHSVGEDVLWAVELGQRAFAAACAENNDHHRWIDGVSILFYMTDTSDDWSDIIAMSRIDTQPDFTLIQGLRAMLWWTDDIEVGIRWLKAWEKKDIIDWKYEEMVRQDLWEDWVSRGGLDDEL